MQTAFDVIKDTYDYETCKEIVNHGCQSGVCSQHIYNADTISFFEQYPAEITRALVDYYGTEFLKEVFNNSDANFDYYMHDLTWAFIELVAKRVVDDKEDQELRDDQTIEEYIMFGPRSLIGVS